MYRILKITVLISDALKEQRSPATTSWHVPDADATATAEDGPAPSNEQFTTPFDPAKPWNDDPARGPGRYPQLSTTFSSTDSKI